MFILFFIIQLYSLAPRVLFEIKEIVIDLSDSITMTEDEELLFNFIQKEKPSRNRFIVDTLIKKINTKGLDLAVIVMLVNRMKQQDEYESLSLEEGLTDALVQLQEEYRYSKSKSDYCEELKTIKMELKSLVFQTTEEQALLEVVSNAYDASYDSLIEKPLSKKEKVEINLDADQNKVSIKDRGVGLNYLGFLTLLFKPHASQKTSDRYRELCGGQEKETEYSIGFMGQGAFASLLFTQEPYNGEVTYTSIEGQVILKQEQGRLRLRLNSDKFQDEGLLFEVKSSLLEENKMTRIGHYFQEKLLWKTAQTCEIILKKSSEEKEEVCLLNQGLVNDKKVLLETEEFRIYRMPSLSTDTFDVNIISQGVALAFAQKYHYSSGQSYSGIVIDLKKRQWVGIDRSSWDWGQEKALELFQLILKEWEKKWEQTESNKKELIGLYICLNDIFKSLLSSYLALERGISNKKSVFNQINKSLSLMQEKCIQESLKQSVSLVSWDPDRPVLYYGYDEQEIQTHKKYLTEPSILLTEEAEYQLLFPSQVSDFSEKAFLMGLMYAQSEEKQLDIPLNQLLDNIVEERQEELRKQRYVNKENEEDEREKDQSECLIEQKQELDNTLVNQFLSEESVLKTEKNAEYQNPLERKFPYIYSCFQQIKEISKGRLKSFEELDDPLVFMIESVYQDEIEEIKKKYGQEIQSCKQQVLKKLEYLNESERKKEDEESMEDDGEIEEDEESMEGDGEIEEDEESMEGDGEYSKVLGDEGVYFYFVMDYLKQNPAIAREVIENAVDSDLIQDVMYRMLKTDEEEWFLGVDSTDYEYWIIDLKSSKKLWIILYGWIKNNQTHRIEKENLMCLSVFSVDCALGDTLYRKVVQEEAFRCSQDKKSQNLLKKFPEKIANQIDRLFQVKMEAIEQKNGDITQKYQNIYLYLKFLKMETEEIELLSEQDIDYMIQLQLDYPGYIKKLRALRKLLEVSDLINKKWESFSFVVQVSIIKTIEPEVLEYLRLDATEEEILLTLEFMDYVCMKAGSIMSIVGIAGVQELSNINVYADYRKKMNKQEYFEGQYLKLQLIRSMSPLKRMSFLGENQIRVYILNLPIDTETERQRIKKISNILSNLKSDRVFMRIAKVGKVIYFKKLLNTLPGKDAFFLMNIINEIIGESLSLGVSQDHPLVDLMSQNFEEGELLVFPSEEVKVKNRTRYELELKKLSKLISNKDTTVMRMVREIVCNEVEAGSPCIDIDIVDMVNEQGQLQKFAIFSGKGSGIEDLKCLIEPNRSSHTEQSDNFGTGTLSILSQCPTYYVRTCHQGCLKEARVRRMLDSSCCIDQLPLKHAKESFTEIYLPLSDNQVEILINAVFEVSKGIKNKEITLRLGEEMKMSLSSDKVETKKIKDPRTQEELEVFLYPFNAPVSFYREGMYLREYTGYHSYTKSIPSEILKISTQELLNKNEQKSQILVSKKWKCNTTRTDIFPNQAQNELLESVFELLSAIQFVRKRSILTVRGLKKVNYTRKDIRGLLQGVLYNEKLNLFSLYKGIWERSQIGDYTGALHEMRRTKKVLKILGHDWNYLYFVCCHPSIKEDLDNIQKNRIRGLRSIGENAFFKMLEKEDFEQNSVSLDLTDEEDQVAVENIGLKKEEISEYEKLFSRLEKVLNNVSFIKKKHLTVKQRFYIGFDNEGLMRIKREGNQVIIDINFLFLKKYITEIELVFPAIIGYMMYHLDSEQTSFVEIQEKYREFVSLTSLAREEVEIESENEDLLMSNLSHMQEGDSRDFSDESESIDEMSEERDFLIKDSQDEEFFEQRGDTESELFPQKRKRSSSLELEIGESPFKKVHQERVYQEEGFLSPLKRKEPLEYKELRRAKRLCLQESLEENQSILKKA